MTSERGPAARPRAPAEALDALREQLGSISRPERPVEWALQSYRVGLACAESPSGSPDANLREALRHYEEAGSVLTARRAPIEHGRILNAAAAAHRYLGETATAVRLFEEATTLLEARGVDLECGAAWSNLGLALVDDGELDRAHDAFGRALQLVRGGTSQARRARIAILVNRAECAAAVGTPPALSDAVQDLHDAATLSDPVELPYHFGIACHTLGTVLLRQVEADGSQLGRRAALLEEAIHQFGCALGVLTRGAFPFAHALACMNVANAYVRRGDPSSLRRALASLEAAVEVLDPRLHSLVWREAYGRLETVHEELQSRDPRPSREAHFVALLATVGPDEQLAMVRDRLGALIDRPSALRIGALVELAKAVALQGSARPEVADAIVANEIAVLMDLPDQLLRDAMHAHVAAGASLERDVREAADRRLDLVIHQQLHGPQRVRVRDVLRENGWQRP